jgi:hypothetical protein
MATEPRHRSSENTGDGIGTAESVARDGEALEEGGSRKGIVRTGRSDVDSVEGCHFSVLLRGPALVEGAVVDVGGGHYLVDYVAYEEGWYVRVPRDVPRRSCAMYTRRSRFTIALHRDHRGCLHGNSP